jgi:hypothetical protein
LQADVFVVGAEAQKPPPQGQLNGNMPMNDFMRHRQFLLSALATRYSLLAIIGHGIVSSKVGC